MLIEPCLALLIAPAAPTIGPAASVVKVHAASACEDGRTGSGVVLKSGIVATNAHVVREASAIQVQKDGSSWPARILHLAPEMDLCLLSVPGISVPPAVLASSEILVPGLDVVSVGYPGGQGPYSRSGNVTYLWSYCGSRLIQADAPTAAGSSGGGLFTKEGSLIGITTFLFEGTSSMSFSVPADWVQNLVRRFSGAPELSPPPCKPLDEVRRDFLGQMAADPANSAIWETFTRSWVKEKPRDPRAWTALGYVLYRKLNDRLGDGLKLDAGLLDETLSATEKALALDARHPTAWNNLGVLLDMENRFEEAERAYQLAIQQDPAYANAWMNLGCTRLNAGRYAQAREALVRALALSGDASRAWALLAACDARLGEWSRAVEHLRKALRYRPLHAQWWLDLAEASMHTGQADIHQTALLKLDQLSPDLAGKGRSLSRRPTTPSTRIK